MMRRILQTFSRIAAGAGVTGRARGAGFAGAIIAAAMLLGLAPALAREEIRAFDTSIAMAANGLVDVTETIAVNAEGSSIRHGIYRDIPIQLINPDKSRLRSELRVISVSRDGRTEPYTVESIGGGFKRIRIGDAEVYLDQGVHTYVIHYTMSRMGRLFADHDELFWNATGNYWEFPILAASATVTLPKGARISGAVGYTGRAGSQEQAVEVTSNGGNTARFKLARELAPGEGMSVAVEFQKGILVEPTGLTAAGYWLSDHRELVFPALAVFLVLLYNFIAWSSVGRDPAKGPIIPLFHPPEGLSPALVHYINRMGFKQNGWTAFTASIFDLGVRGLVSIDKAGKSTTITATDEGKETVASTLPAGEGGIYNFIRSRDVVTLDKTDGPALNRKRGELVSEIKSASGESYFKNNLPYTIVGLVLAALMLGAMVWLDVLDVGMVVVAVVVAAVVGVILGVLTGTAAGGIVGKLFGIVWIAIIGVNVFGSAASLASGLRLDTGFVAAVSIIVIEIAFAFLMRAPTVAGRRLMDQIDGFKMYLDTAEKNRLNYIEKGEPPMTVVRFESILPFAIALGVEKLWSERFEADLARNAVADAHGGVYSPLWYTGGNWSKSSSGFSNAMSSMATGMSAAMIAAQPSSSSGSGFSGGGSGGGGGGGGGGGW
jgi:hypothetical protein